MYPIAQHYERIANNIQRRRFNEYHDDRSEMQTSDNPEVYFRKNSFYVAPNADNDEGFIEGMVDHTYM